MNNSVIKKLKENKFQYFNECLEFCLDIGLSVKQGSEIAYKFKLELNNGFYLSESHIFRYVKSWEDIASILKIKKLPNVKFFPKEYQDRIIAEYKLLSTIKVLNNNWIKDWDNSNEYYYVPYFDMRNGTFSYHDFLHWAARCLTVVGSGFKNKELMFHAVKYFLKEYEIYMKGKTVTILKHELEQLNIK